MNNNAFISLDIVLSILIFSIVISIFFTFLLSFTDGIALIQKKYRIVEEIYNIVLGFSEVDTAIENKRIVHKSQIEDISFTIEWELEKENEYYRSYKIDILEKDKGVVIDEYKFTRLVKK